MIVVLKRWLPALLLAMIGLAVMAAMTGPVSHAGKQRPTALRIDERSLEDGDMIFRRGVGLTSDFVVSVDRASLFSHVGMICKKAGHAYVIHILPDEGRGEDDTVRMEPLARFLSPENASGFAVCRLSGQHVATAQRAASAALFFWKKGVGYDYELDGSNARQLYCSELVWQAYKKAGIDLLDGRLQPVRFPFYQGRYVLISGLLNSRWLETIRQQ